MAFNFPNTPTVGQVFTPIAGVSYIWTGSQWDRMAPATRTFDPGTVVAFAGAVLPAGTLWCDGSTFIAGDYPLLYAALGNSNVLPDLRGRTVFGKDDMGGTAANRLTNTGVGNSGINGKVLGSFGGVDRYTITINQAPAHTHSGNTGNESAGHTHGVSIQSGLESANHRHYNDFNSQNDNVDHTHWIAGQTDDQGSHSHGYLQMGTVSNTLATGSNASRNNVAGTTDAAGTHRHNIAFSSGGASARHLHQIAGWTGYVDANHSHLVSGNTGGISANHTHAFTSDSKGGGEAHPIIPPAFVLNYIIYTGA